MHVIQGKCSFDSSQSGKLKLYGSGTVSTSSCMFRTETNGETDHLQHDLFVDISYTFTLAYGFVSYASASTMNTCLSGKKFVLLHRFSALWWMPTHSIIVSHDHFSNSHEQGASLMTLLLVIFYSSDYVCTLLLQTIVVKCGFMYVPKKVQTLL